MMLEWLGFKTCAAAVEQAVKDAIASGETTKDLGGKCSTQEAGTAIRDRITAG
jgi:isocitrate/isopropylmalate dehydrogenase